jgi:hypothetical protein
MDDERPEREERFRRLYYAHKGRHAPGADAAST